MFKQLKLTYIYYAVPSVIFTALFFSLYSVKKLCWDLDTFLMTGDLKSLITLLAGGALFFVALSRTIKFYGVFVNARRVKRFNNFLYGLKSSFGVFGEPRLRQVAHYDLHNVRFATCKVFRFML